MKNTIEKWLDGEITIKQKTNKQMRTETRKNKVITDRGWFNWRKIKGTNEFGFERNNLFTSLVSGIKKKINTEK